MHKQTRRLFAGAALVGAALTPVAQAATLTIDFEPASLTGLYMAGEIFSQGAFTMKVDFDAGIVDGAGALGGSAPTGNLTQFYSQLNEGGLIMQRSDGALFDLKSFDAAFVPLSPAATGATVMVAVGVYANNSSAGVAWLFASSATSNFPFSHYGNPLDFATFNQVKQVEFFACAYDGVTVCSGPLHNNGQFAIDNITASVPEPTTIAMVTLGLLGLALRGRRSIR